MNAARNVIFNIDTLIAQRGKVDSHPGLLLQRYLRESSTGEFGKPEEKRTILDAAIRSAAHPELRALYKTAYERWT